MKAQTRQGPPPRVVGCILGVQSGRNVEIFNSFELSYDRFKNEIDMDFLKQKQEQYKKVFPSYDVLGWYSTTPDVYAHDLHIHRAIQSVNESSLYVVLDPVRTTKELPVSIFESEVHIINDAPTTIFVPTPFKVETGEAERIAVDHVARIVPLADAPLNMLTAHLSSTHSSIKMLNSRLATLRSFLALSQTGSLPKDHHVLRQVASLCNRLPAIDTQKFATQFVNEHSDGLLIMYLASVTKSLALTNDLIDKCGFIQEKYQRRPTRYNI